MVLRLLALTASLPLLALGSGELTVSENGRRLVHEDGSAFVWVGDTAWNLFVRLDRDEARQYLEDRQGKGFTVIQATAVSFDHATPNAYGEAPLIEGDFDRPNKKYFEHVDWVVARADELGLHVLLLPVWARAHIENEQRLATPDQARRFGEFLARRYRDRTNLMWCLGGDVKPTRHEIYDAMAAGIVDGLGRDPLMTYHPPGGTYRPPATSTGEWYHDKPWLDFNMLQSGHSRGNENYLRVAEDYARTPVKPTLDGEPCYEQHPIRHKLANGVFNAWDLRQRAYWSVLAGAFGFTYGGNGIWQMDKPGQIFKETHHTHFWYDALDHEAAGQMRHLNAFLSEYPERVPDQTILDTPAGSKENRLQAARTSDGSTWLIYDTNGRTFSVRLPAEDGRARWWSPRSGENIEASWTAEQDPPSEPGADHDWVLILEPAE